MRGVGSAARGAALVPRPAAAAADIRHGPELRRQPAATVAAPSAAATATAASRCRPKQPERRTCAPRASSVAGSNGSAQHPASSPRDAASETRATASVAPANADIKQALPREEPKEGRAPTTATLLLQCPDQRGVVASTAQLLYGFGMNIVRLPAGRLPDKAVPFPHQCLHMHIFCVKVLGCAYMRMEPCFILAAAPMSVSMKFSAQLASSFWFLLDGVVHA